MREKKTIINKNKSNKIKQLTYIIIYKFFWFKIGKAYGYTISEYVQKLTNAIKKSII